MRRMVVVALAFVGAAGGAVAAERAPGAGLPPAGKMLFWTAEQQAIGFKSFDKLYASRTVRRGAAVKALPADPAIAVSYSHKGQAGDIDSFMRDGRVFGLLVIKDGRIQLERYAGGFGPTDRWTSYSVAKSMTSTLVGAALKDGRIRSLDEPVAGYVPALRGTGYDGVTIRQALNMSTGVKWDENYLDPASDTNATVAVLAGRRSGGLLRHVAGAPRAWAPDSRFDYNTGATHVLGAVVSAATGQHLADYLSEKVWGPAGMEADAAWTTDGADAFGGCCVNARLRDFGRFGLYALNGFVGADGVSRTPDGWTAMIRAGSPASKGYGAQWWILSERTFAALGVFGQMIYIEPDKNLVIVTLSAHPTPVSQDDSARAEAFSAAVSARWPDPRNR